MTIVQHNDLCQIILKFALENEILSNTVKLTKTKKNTVIRCFGHIFQPALMVVAYARDYINSFYIRNTGSNQIKFEINMIIMLYRLKNQTLCLLLIYM